MTYLAYWIILSICTYLLTKNTLEKLLKPIGGVVAWLDKGARLDGDKSLELVPDQFKIAVCWTYFLILSLFLWPVVLSFTVYYTWFPERFIRRVEE